ncbi:MAG: restriction endonuclease subunit S [Balneola sp.]
MTEELSIDLKNLDKSDWKSYRFDEIAENISERVDPNDTELDIYVGLEHIDGEDLHIRRHGTSDDVNGQKLRFYPGDIIFGRRRAYQRKAAIAEWDGFCSAHALVLRAKPEVIDPKLFPFFMHSDQFMHRAVDISVGSLSPTINWGTLKSQEFLLPPKDQQAELAELLWAMDEVVERNKNLFKMCITYKKSFFKSELYSNYELKEFFFNDLKPRYEIEKVGRYLKAVQYGISKSLSDEGDVPILRMNNLIDGKVDLADLKYYNPEDGELDKFYLESGDVLFNRTNSFELVGKTGIYENDKRISFASYLIRLQTEKEKLDSAFLNFYMNSEIGMSRIRNYRTPGVSQSNINAQNLKSMPIPVPPIEKQESIMNKINYIESVELKAEGSIKYMFFFQKSLINQIF